jgi:hypothetical protein
LCCDEAFPEKGECAQALENRIHRVAVSRPNLFDGARQREQQVAGVTGRFELASCFTGGNLKGAPFDGKPVRMAVRHACHVLLQIERWEEAVSYDLKHCRLIAEPACC